MVRSPVGAPTGCWRCLMTKDEAKQVLQMLLGAFPRHGLDDNGVRMWGESLSRTDFDIAATAARQVIQRDEFMPSIAKFAGEVRHTVNLSKRGSINDDCTNPDGCQGWWMKQSESAVVNGDGEVVEIRTMEKATPCSECRPDLFARWKDGSIHKSKT
mgnify:FL=1